MAVTIRKKSKAEKGDTLTLRISAKDKFALELLSNIQDRSLSSIVMEALREPLKAGLTMEKKEGRGKTSVYIPDVTYHPLLPHRIVNLALTAPDLLTNREKVIWTVIQENPAYMNEGTPDLKRIKERWESIQTEADELLDKHSG